MNATLAKASVLGIAVVLAIAGCGDDGDDDDDATDASPEEIEEVVEDDDDGEAEIDLCSLLEVSEIEAEFGQQGTVLDGEEELDQCTWEVGEDQSQQGTGTVSVYVQSLIPPGQSTEEFYADQLASAPEAVEVPGVADEAFYQPPPVTVLNARQGDTFFFVQAAFIPEVEGSQEKLENLATLVAGRL